MKFSIVRTDKDHAVHLTVKPSEWFFERIRVDTKAGDVARLRAHIARAGDTDAYENEHPVARVLPSVELERSANGNLVIVQFNGLVTLHVGGLMREDDRQAVKTAVSALPMTYAAFTGADGRSVEVLVSVCRADGSLPQPQEPQTGEAGLDRFCQSAYDMAMSVYGGILPHPAMRLHVTARSSFRMTLDETPYCNPAPTPLLVPLHSTPTHRQHAAASGSQPSQPAPDLLLYADYERMYERAAEEAYDETADVIVSQREEAYITELARRMCLMGMPEEEAFLHLRNHHAYKPGYDADTCRAIVSAVYYENKAEHTPAEMAGVSTETRRLLRFLTSRYAFRYNTVMGYAEYRPNNTWVVEWKPCDEQAINGLAIEARLANLDVREKDVRRYVYSNRLPVCDPVEDYFWRIRDRWDGRTDHIGMLARTVPCDIPQWEQWFRKWMLAMVAQWLGRMRDYGNALVPLLISPQGDNKSTFCRQLLPPELRWGFHENMEVKEGRPTLQAMHSFLLINLDEFNRIPAKVQSGFLKNIIQLPSVKLKRPYGKHVEEFSRMASFIATTNEQTVLSDPTGSRRFIAVQLTAPIDISRQPNYDALYAQAQQLVLSGERYWLTAEETAELTEHNRRYYQQPPALMYFNEYYEAAHDGDDGQWLSATAIYQRLRHEAGAGLQASGLTLFGRMLRSVPGLRTRRTNSGQLYYVREKQ